MLVLTRKAGEALVMNGKVLVKIMSIQGSQVRIGIDVPENFKLCREDIYARIKRALKTKD